MSPFCGPLCVRSRPSIECAVHSGIPSVSKGQSGSITSSSPTDELPLIHPFRSLHHFKHDSRSTPRLRHHVSPIPSLHPIDRPRGTSIPKDPLIITVGSDFVVSSSPTSNCFLSEPQFSLRPVPSRPKTTKIGPIVPVPGIRPRSPGRPWPSSISPPLLSMVAPPLGDTIQDTKTPIFTPPQSPAPKPSKGDDKLPRTPAELIPVPPLHVPSDRNPPPVIRQLFPRGQGQEHHRPLSHRTNHPTLGAQGP